MKEIKENNEISPSQYFDYLKGAKQNINNEQLKESYGVFLKLGEKYTKTGQKESFKKLCFLANTLIKEEHLIELGVTTYVYKDKIEEYIENVASKTVKIVELSRYMREIPDELIEVIEKTRGIFDEFYVVFTDYTGKEERKVDKERRDKDPILFGCFKNDRNVGDRFYFLGDWVDEYCDLTLDKMIDEYKSDKGYSPVITEKIPTTSEELIDILKAFSENNNVNTSNIEFYSDDSINGSIPLSAYKVKEDGTTKKSFFDKVRNIFKK